MKPQRCLKLAFTNQNFRAEGPPGGAFNVTENCRIRAELFNLCVTQSVDLLTGFRHMGGLRSIKGFTIFPMLYTVSQRLVGIQSPLTNLKGSVKIAFSYFYKALRKKKDFV